LHRWWFQDSSFALADDGLPQSVSRVRSSPASELAVTGPSDQFGSVPEGFGRALPIRLFEDLLPYTRVSTEEAVALVTQVIEEQNGCSMDSEAVGGFWWRKQIRLGGAFTLHSDCSQEWGRFRLRPFVAVVEGDRFPHFGRAFRTPDPARKSEI